ncbi:GGDEF domain-containing protein [Pseudoalteromonas haloplanktis]|uniref:diguanylate cyclase n=1 Tax=Pseudoalteromonas haloplanktis TaxID=228 RepID=A0ABU1BEV0_PSEHA|nr:GGDEF domain-containing protein [Pseudoalteromonas haloplanktis]MDQ9093028.1 GGDEF domain-containing protein [Pseudoalteromonas haloplanktis]
MAYCENEFNQQLERKWLHRAFASMFILSLVLIVVLYCIFLPDLDEHIFLNGVLTDAINFLIVVAIFVIVQKANLSTTAYVHLSLGLTLWTAGLTFDLLDEILTQPLFIGIYVEDILRTAGMLLTCYGLKLTMADLKRTQQRLSKELTTDYLTKIANRRFFYQHMQQVQTQRFTLIIIDIDFFKSINDEFGHDVGDKVLTELAALYSKAFSQECVFARLGGEEFAVFVPGDDQQFAIELSQQLLAIARTIELKKQRKVTVSIGVSFKTANESLTEVVKRADQALYKAKNSGRDQYNLA